MEVRKGLTDDALLPQILIWLAAGMQQLLREERTIRSHCF